MATAEDAHGPPPGPPLGEGPRVPPAGSSTTPTLFLSVFLLLSGFFVLLIALSEFDRDRTRRVLDSLGRQFAGPASTEGTDFPPVAGHPLSPFPVEEEPRRLLRFGPPVTAEAERAGVVGRIELDASRLFDERGEVPRARWLLFGRMAAATRDARGWRLEIAAPWPAPGEVEALAGRMDRVLALLARLGADLASVTYGLERPGEARWSFTVRDPEPGAAG